MPHNPTASSSGFPFRGRLGGPSTWVNMATGAAALLTNPGLVAIALVIRSKDGPHFVFHYPARPSNKPTQREARYGTELDTEPPAEDDDYDSDDSDLEENALDLSTWKKPDLNDKGSVKAHQKNGHEDSTIGDEHYDDGDGKHIVPWEQLFEFPTADLESILTPSRAFHKKKFELSLDPLQFVTYPMHIREDGLWKKKKSKRSKRSKKEEDDNGNGEGKTEDSKTASGNGTPEDGEEHGGMTMFNVVFILNIPKEEEDERIQEIYENIIKKFNKALNHAQASNDYVWKESEMILTMKDKAKEERRPLSWLWGEILIKSTLAGAIRDVYNSVTNNKIATVHLASKPPLDLSLQIPVPAYLTSYPSSDERAMLGLIITSADPMVSDDGEEPAHLNKHFALLLLDDEDKIIAEIQSDNTELSAPLIECIRLCKPTASFLQVAQTQSVELGGLLMLAQHLVYWRRAIAIPPLHAREMYIVSPNCDSRRLPRASIAWKKAFPLAPSLPSYLAALSAAPRAYKTFSPSKNHRPTYLDMLAWAIRGGWVTQLRTFAWILVWPEILYEVQYQLKAEAVKKAKNKTSSEPGSGPNNESDESNSDKKNDTEKAAEKARLERLAKKAEEDAIDFAKDFAQMPTPVATTNPSTNNASHLDKIAPYIIKDPHKVSHEESLYIAAYAKRFTDPKIKECWFKFCAKYFNGKEALEMICLQEGMKRKETWSILMHFQEIILVCKHW